MSHSIRPEVNNFKFGFTFLVRHEENSCHERFSASFAIFMARTENNGLTTSLALYNVPLNIFGHLRLNTSLALFLARTENYEINSSLPNSLTYHCMTIRLVQSKYLALMFPVLKLAILWPVIKSVRLQSS